MSNRLPNAVYNVLMPIAKKALLEARVAFAGLLERFTSIRLLSEPEYRNQIVLRGVENLWIEVDQ